VIPVMVLADHYRMACDHARELDLGREGRDWIYLREPSQLLGYGRGGRYTSCTEGVDRRLLRWYGELAGELWSRGWLPLEPRPTSRTTRYPRAELREVSTPSEWVRSIWEHPGPVRRYIAWEREAAMRSSSWMEATADWLEEIPEGWRLEEDWAEGINARAAADAELRRERRQASDRAFEAEQELYDWEDNEAMEISRRRRRSEQLPEREVSFSWLAGEKGIR